MLQCRRSRFSHVGSNFKHKLKFVTFLFPSALFHRQLSKEQQELKVALERQAVINQKLSQEKEQLMFKLRHRDSCPTIHLPAMMQEIAPR